MAPGRERPQRGQAAQLIGLGTMVFACVVVGLGGGYFADRLLGTAPWLLLTGLGFGIAAAGVNFYRAIQVLNRTDGGGGNA